jgi:hypothetical protein
MMLAHSSLVLLAALALALAALALLLLALLAALAVALATATLLGGGGARHGHGLGGAVGSGDGVHLSTLTADFGCLLAHRTGAVVTEPGGNRLLLEEVEAAGDGGIRGGEGLHGDGTRDGLGDRISNEDVANEGRDGCGLFRPLLGWRFNRNQDRRRRMQERIQVLHDGGGIPPLPPELQRRRTTGLNDQSVRRILWEADRFPSVVGCIQLHHTDRSRVQQGVDGHRPVTPGDGGVLGHVRAAAGRGMVHDETRVLFVTGIALHGEGGSRVVGVDAMGRDVPRTGDWIPQSLVDPCGFMVCDSNEGREGEGHR